MKLPIILGAMIAALAIPGSIANEVTEEKTETPAPEAEATAPEAEKTAPAKGKKKKASGAHHATGAHHHKKHARPEGHTNPPSDPYKGEYDDGRLQKADGYPRDDYSPKAGQMEVPGQKTP